MAALGGHYHASIAVDIRLLGPVELTGDNRPVRLGRPRSRTLLGLLGLRAPEVVSCSALIDGLWDSSPPANAAKTLRAHIAYLRRDCAAAGLPGLIATRSPGYALAVPATCVDVHRFEEAVGRAMVASGEGKTEVMVAELREALAMWRGDVLADCAAGEWARAQAARLQEVRLHAFEELLDGELTLGEHARVIAEAESLVAQYPLRERLWELLMRALYQDGRQGEALAVYRRARARLVDELGIEPGPGLRRLQAAILDGGELDRVEAAGPAGPRTRRAPIGRTTAAYAIPAPLTNLVGRAAEIAELAALLTDRRLITLTGIGGCGKTRLAMAVGTEVAGRYPGGVRFLDLTALSDPQLLPATVAAALGVPDDLADDPLNALVGHLAGRPTLLVLDSCERVADACASLVEALLRSCPTMQVLATSRQTLGVPGEVVWPVPPLSVPPCPAPPDLKQVAQYSAVQLFLQRATAAAVRQLTDADAPALAAICAGLDGLPLAIELAAGRTAVLTVAEIAERRLYDPALLHDERQPHRSIEEAVAWSYDLLDARTQARFRRLAVFVGGFDLAAAEAVWPEPNERPAVDVLTDLVDKSLVTMKRGIGGARFHMLETIRRWALDRLAADPEEERITRRRHAQHFLDLAEQADRQLRGPQVGEWLARLSAEHDNFCAARGYAAQDPGLPGVELRLAVALAQYCRLRGQYREGLRWLEDALARLPHAPDGLASPAHAAAARLTFLLGDYSGAGARARRALAIDRQCKDHAGTARMLRLLGCLARELGEYAQSLARINESLELPGTDETAIADGRQLAGFTAWLSGDLDLAERLLADALDHYTRLGDAENIVSTQTHLAAVAFYRGDVAEARELAEHALAKFADLDVKEGISWALNLLGLIAHAEGRLAEARDALRSSLEVHYAIGDRWRQASVLEALAGVLLDEGKPVSAARLAGVAGALRRALHVPVPAVERPAWARVQAKLRRRLPADERRAALAAGAAMRVPDVLADLAGCSSGR